MPVIRQVAGAASGRAGRAHGPARARHRRGPAAMQVLACPRAAGGAAPARGHCKVLSRAEGAARQAREGTWTRRAGGRGCGKRILGCDGPPSPGGSRGSAGRGRFQCRHVGCCFVCAKCQWPPRIGAGAMRRSEAKLGAWGPPHMRTPRPRGTPGLNGTRPGGTKRGEEKSWRGARRRGCGACGTARGRGGRAGGRAGGPRAVGPRLRPGRRRQSPRRPSATHAAPPPRGSALRQAERPRARARVHTRCGPSARSSPGRAGRGARPHEASRRRGRALRQGRPRRRRRRSAPPAPSPPASRGRCA